MTKFLGNTIRWFLVIIWILLLVFFGYPKHAQGSTGVRKPDSPPDFYVNQHSYALGFITGVNMLEPGKGRTWTLVSFKPSYTPLLYPDDQMLFCGQVAGKFVNLTSADEIIIVFSRAVSVARINSPPPAIIACHNLEYVKKVSKEQQ